MQQTDWEEQFLSLMERIARCPQDIAPLLRDFPKPVYFTDADGWLTHWNDAAVALWGFAPTPGAARWCGCYRIYTCHGALLPHDECPMAIAIKQCRPVRKISAVLERPDGGRVVFTPYPTPFYDEGGEMRGAANMLLPFESTSEAPALH